MIIYDRTEKKFYFSYSLEKKKKRKDYYHKIFIEGEDYSNRDLLFFTNEVILLDPSYQKYLKLYKAGNIKILNPGENKILLFNNKFVIKIEIFNLPDEIIKKGFRQEYETGLWLMKNHIGPKMYDFSENKFSIFQYEYSMIVMQKLNMGTLEDFAENYKDDIYKKEKIDALVDLFKRAHELKFIHDDLHSKNVMFHQELNGKIKAYFIDALIDDNDLLNFNSDDFYYILLQLLEFGLSPKIEGSNIISELVIAKMQNFPDRDYLRASHADNDL